MKNHLLLKKSRRNIQEKERKTTIISSETILSSELTTPSENIFKPKRFEKVARRRQIDPTTCERDYSSDEIEFMNALDAYKRSSGRMFPTCSEILEVVLSLGYVKTPKIEEDVPLIVKPSCPRIASSVPFFCEEPENVLESEIPLLEKIGG